MKYIRLEYEYLTGAPYYATELSHIHYIGSEDLPIPDLSQFKTQRQMSDECGGGEFQDYEHLYEMQLEEIKIYIKSLGYEVLQFETIGI